MPAFFIASSDIRETAITLTGDLCHHLRASLRVKPGECLWLTDEQRRRYRVTVMEVKPERLVTRIVEQIEGPGEKGPAMLLAQALLKGDHMDWVVQKASELGVRSIVPVIARMSDLVAGGWPKNCRNSMGANTRGACHCSDCCAASTAMRCQRDT